MQRKQILENYNETIQPAIEKAVAMTKRDVEQIKNHEEIELVLYMDKKTGFVVIHNWIIENYSNFNTKDLFSLISINCWEEHFVEDVDEYGEIIKCMNAQIKQQNIYKEIEYRHWVADYLYPTKQNWGIALGTSKEDVRNEIEELLIEMQQTHLTLLKSIRQVVQKTSDTKINLLELKENIQREYDKQPDVFINKW